MRQRCLFLLLWCWWLLIPGPTAAQPIGSILSGFDVYNRTGEPASDFHLILTGMSGGSVMQTVSPPGWVSSTTVLPDGSVVLSWQGSMLVFPGQSGAFGVEVSGAPDWRVVCAFWTWNGRVLFPMIAWPNQRWNALTGTFVDIVDGYRPLVSPFVGIERQFTVMRGALPLSELNWDGTATLPWEPGFGPETLTNNPDMTLDLPIPMGMPDGAVLVRYPVTSPTGIIEARYTNQLVVQPFMPGPMFSNFDVVNLTGLCVNDFHVVLEGVHCSDLLAGPEGLYTAPGWIAVCVDTPLGCELRWTRIDGGCVMPGEMVHFGYGLWYTPVFRIRAAYWTWNGIPLPPFLDPVQQTWENMGGLVVDRVWGYPPLVEPMGVIFRRDFAMQAGGGIPLAQLNREGTADLQWLPADDGWTMAPPDPAFQSPFVFPPVPFQTGALFIRYDVYGGGEELFVAFTNEARLGGALPPIPPIQDLRIERIMDTSPDMLHLRLHWSPPINPSTPLQYRVIGFSNPYDISTGETVGYTIDSFFDIWYELEPEAPPLAGYRVTADYLVPVE
jgi:hypothetical protein